MSLAILFLCPFVGTLLGSAAVYFFHDGIGEKTGKAVTGFAGGVMIAASVWSLLLPAIEQSSYYIAALGFLLGVAFLLLLDTIVPHIHATAEKAEGRASGLSKSSAQGNSSACTGEPSNSRTNHWTNRCTFCRKSGKKRNWNVHVSKPARWARYCVWTRWHNREIPDYVTAWKDGTPSTAATSATAAQRHPARIVPH